MSITEKTRFEQIRRSWNSRLRALRIDRKNQKLYGEDAPRFAEGLTVPVNQIEYAAKIGSSKDSGKVIEQWPARPFDRVNDATSIRACLLHWQEGLSWEQTGIYDVMLDAIRRNGKVDKLRTIEDIRRRYEFLDQLYKTVKIEGRLRSRQELVAGNFREEGGLLIHIGPDGSPYFGRKGNHRLAIAIAAELPVIPAQLGLVHSNGLKALAAFRDSSETAKASA